MMPLAEDKTYGYASSDEIIDNASYAANAFTFTKVEGGYAIQDTYQRYYYHDAAYKTFSVTETLPATGGVWTLSMNEDGTFVIRNVDTQSVIRYAEGDYTSFGVYGEGQGEGSVLPILVLAENPVSESPVLWYKNATDLTGYDAANKTRLAKYGDYILVANTTKVFALNPADGSIATTFDVPGGMTAHSICVDDAGTVILSADAGIGADLTIYTVADPFNPDPQVLATYNTGNYYGTDTGNIRVSGDLSKNAVITATVSAGAGGACIIWEVVDGVCSDWTWTTVPYAADSISFACCTPAGNTLADGLWYIGYGGDYNLYHAADVVKGGASTWTNAYTTGSSWMENYNCVAAAEWNGKDYVAVLAGCHFNYDATDVWVLDASDPTACVNVLSVNCDGLVERDEAWANLDWTGLGTYSDVLLVPEADALKVYFIDGNFNILGCAQYK